MHPRRRVGAALAGAALGAVALLSGASGPPADATATIPAYDHVVLAIFENHEQTQIVGSSNAPYLTSLAAQGASFTQAYAIEHPSQPNYLDLLSGSNQGVTDDSCPHTFATDNIAHQLIASGRTFSSFNEDLPAAGSPVCTSAGYARKHNPWTNFSDLDQPTVSKPYTAMPTDLSQLPTMSWIVPNLCDDMHDCTVNTGDTWARDHLDAYAQWAKTHNSLLIVTFDEDDSAGANQITTLFVGDHITPGSYAEHIDHFTVLRTLEDMYGLAPLGAAANRSPLTDVFTGNSTPQPTVVTVADTADAYANAGAPTSNVGSSSSLYSRGSPGAVSLLRFALPAAPAGKALTSAVLHVHTTTDGGSGSSEAHTVASTTGAWSESALTWNNRPPINGPALATVPAGTTANTALDLALDPAGVSALLGTSSTLTLTDAGTDSLILWSREFAAAGQRPSLTLTFSPLGDMTAPTAPTAVGATAAGFTITLSWTASTDDVGVTSYDVYRSTTPGFTPTAADLLGTTSATSFSDSASHGTFSYVVDARDAAGNVSAFSPQATVTIADQTPPSAPTGVVASVSGHQVSLAWTASTDDVGVDGYDVLRCSSSDVVATVAATTFAETVADGSWCYVVVAHDAAGNRSTASAPVTAIVGGDVTPPSPPTGLAAAASGSSVSLSWTNASDDVRVVSYDVLRNGTKVATVTSTSFSDAAAPAGTLTYTVTAADAAGNVSAASGPASVTLAPTLATVSPTADTFANAGAPSGTNGTSSSLYSRGNVGAVTYLRFVLPAAPPGRTLSRAVLRLRTTTDAGSGSIDPQTVSVASDGWGETTLTWANRPAITGPALGVVAAGTSSNTVVDTSLDPTVLLTGQQTIAVTSTSTDSFIAWSREFSAVAYRPQLLLTWS